MKSKTWLISLTFLVVLILAYSGMVTNGSYINQESSTDNVLRVKDAPLFGTADSFVVLAGTGVINTGDTTVTGDVGTYPTITETGFESVTILNGTNHVGDNVTQTAKEDLVTAYNDAALRTQTAPDGDTLGGLNLGPGVYHGGALNLTGNLTLTGGGNDVWIFQAASSLITASNSMVILSGGAKAANVYWQVGSSATLGGVGGAGSTFKGNIIALTSITLNTGTNVEGRVLARNGAVTLHSSTVTKPAP